MHCGDFADYSSVIDGMGVVFGSGVGSSGAVVAAGALPPAISRVRLSDAVVSSCTARMVSMRVTSSAPCVGRVSAFQRLVVRNAIFTPTSASAMCSAAITRS